MSKNTKQATSAPTFNEGDAVLVTIDGKEGLATYHGTASGWYVVELANPAAFGREKTKASVRAASIKLADLKAARMALAQAEAAEGNDGDEEDLTQEEAEEKVQSAMSKALQEARKRYTKAHRPNGARTAHNGDNIAKELIDLEPLEVADLADDVVKAPKGTHRAKYQHLNPGQIRMNSGNRIRAYWKNINEDGDAAEIRRVGILLGLVSFDEAAEAECHDEEAGE